MYCFPSFKIHLNKSFFILVSLSLCCAIGLFAQQDSLVFNNEKNIVGKIKSMENGILTMETGFSDSDFKIEWKEVVEIYTGSFFLILLKDGGKYIGKLTSDGPVKVNLNVEENSLEGFDIPDIVSLTQIKQKFLDRFDASIDLGFNLIKANETKQFSARTAMAYTAQNWTTNLRFNTIFSRQEGAERIRRIEASVNEKYIFSNNWFSFFTISSLSNAVLNIDMRLNTQLGLGHFIIRTNSLYWSIKSGINHNIENYSNQTINQRSWEGYFATEANFFNTGDLSLNTIFEAFPGITKKGRWRTDWSFDVKYDLPLNLYVKVGGSISFDNQPAVNSNKSDYILQSGLGWEL